MASVTAAERRRRVRHCGGVVVILAALALNVHTSAAESCTVGPNQLRQVHIRISESVPVNSRLVEFQLDMDNEAQLRSDNESSDASLQYFEVRNFGDNTAGLVVRRSLSSLTQSQNRAMRFYVICHSVVTGFSELTVTLSIEKALNDEVQFVGGPYNVNISELTKLGAPLIDNILVVDRKLQRPTAVNFSITSGNRLNKFQVSPIGLGRAAIMLRSPLDFDRGDKIFEMTLTATDWANQSKRSSTKVIIRVIDGDDLPPKFTAAEYRVDVLEHPGPMLPIELLRLNSKPPIKAYDQDLGRNETLVYRINSGQYLDHFFLDPLTGTLSLKKTFDRETLPFSTLEMRVQAYQRNNMGKIAGAKVIVSVLDADDNVAKFSVDLYNMNVPENTPTNFRIAGIQAKDDDEGENAMFKYMLEGSELALSAFSIDEATGELVVRNQALLDREQQDSVSLTVFAVPVKRLGARSSANVIIRLTDVNDNTPQFVPSQFYNMSISADRSPIALIGQVRAEDADLGDNALVQYSLLNDSSGDSAFRVDRSNGQVFLTRSLRPGSYQLFIQAEDSPSLAAERLSTVAVVVVAVQQPTQSPPVVISTTSSSSPSTTTMITKGTLVFRPVISREEQTDTVPPETTTVESSGETTTELGSTETTTELGSTETTTELGSTETITTEDPWNSLDHRPFFTVKRSPVTVGVPHDSNYGFKVARLRAVDADENDTLSYRLTSHDKSLNDVYSIDRDTGDVWLIKEVSSVPYRKHILTAHVSDRKNLTNSVKLVVYVLDVGDMAVVQVNRSTDEVWQNIDKIAYMLSEATGSEVKIARVLAAQEHDYHHNNVAIDQTVHNMSDVWIYAFDGQSHLLLDGEYLARKIKRSTGLMAPSLMDVRLAGPTLVPSAGREKSMKYVILALAVVILLLMLVILTVVCCKKRKSPRANSHAKLASSNSVMSGSTIFAAAAADDHEMMASPHLSKSQEMVQRSPSDKTVFYGHQSGYHSISRRISVNKVAPSHYLASSTTSVNSLLRQTPMSTSGHLPADDQAAGAAGMVSFDASHCGPYVSATLPRSSAALQRNYGGRNGHTPTVASTVTPISELPPPGVDFYQPDPHMEVAEATMTLCSESTTDCANDHSPGAVRSVHVGSPVVPPLSNRSDSVLPAHSSGHQPDFASSNIHHTDEQDRSWFYEVQRAVF